MEVKGTAVSSIASFVKNKHGNRYDEWLQSMPELSRKIYESPIYSYSWYPMTDAAVVPMEKLGRIAYGSAFNAAKESGKYSAEQGLRGIYKAFVMVASPIFLMKRATMIMTAYYKPSELKLVESTKKGFTIHIIKFPDPNMIIEYRIVGWMQRALEITKCKNVYVRITRSLTQGHPVTEFKAKWD